MVQTVLVPTEVCPAMTAPSGPLGGTENRAYCGYLFNAGTPDCQMYAYWPFVYGAFRSEHVDAASFAMTDGSVRLVRDSVAFDTYRALSTRAGGEVASLD
jgi:hypothetical protein